MIPMIRNGLSWNSELSMPDDRSQQLHHNHNEQHIVDAVRDLGNEVVSAQNQMVGGAVKNDRGDYEQQRCNDVVCEVVEAVDHGQRPTSRLPLLTRLRRGTQILLFLACRLGAHRSILSSPGNLHN